MTTRVTFMGVAVSPRNAQIAEMMMSGSTFTEVANALGIDENMVRTYCIRLRERGIPIPRQKRFKLIATSEAGERFEFIGKADVEQRGGYGYRQAHKAAQRGCEYLGMTWSKDEIDYRLGGIVTGKPR